MAKAVSPDQIEFFNKLTREKQFPAGSDLDALRTRFTTLDSASASDWIEKALSLDDLGDVPRVTPEF